MGLAVNFGDKPETVAAYFSREKLSMIPLLQKKGETSSAFGIRAYPTTYLIGPDATIRWRGVGFDEASLKKELDTLLPAK